MVFGKACNYGGFLKTSEIQEIVNYEESLIFENRISKERVKQLRRDNNLMVNTSFSIGELFLNNRFVPIYRKEKLAEYSLNLSRFNKICSYRARMSFQFKKLKVREGDEEIYLQRCDYDNQLFDNVVQIN